MASNSSRGGIAQIFRDLRARSVDEHTDGDLLIRFLAARDEAAFATLVARHGPMVLGVCQRVLHNTADAEDAFQATYLILVRKAETLRSRAALGDWLHGVALRTALEARRALARRRLKERTAARPEVQNIAQPTNDTASLLDEELARLANKYRLPIQLCDLEGRTRKEAAEQLGWPEGTVAGRLARGRARLASRLARRGLSVALPALPPKAAPATVSASLASSTTVAATRTAPGQVSTGLISARVTSLVEGVLRAMLVTKLAALAGVFGALVLLAAGTGAALLPSQAPRHPAEIAHPITASADGRFGEVSETTQKQSAPPKEESTPDKTTAADRIALEDIIHIQATNTLPEAPIDGDFRVEKSGKVALGVYYGRVSVKNLTLEEAEMAIQKQLANVIAEPKVLVTRPLISNEFDNPVGDFERRIARLEREVRNLQAAVQSLQKGRK